MINSHIPVLLEQVVEIINPRDGGNYIDATFGAGGYSKEVLSKADCIVHAIDRDSNVDKYYQELQTSYNNKIKLTIARFSEIGDVFQDKEGLIDGIMFDVGVSSMQLANPERGFSFMHDAPLDMRMGQDGVRADDFVNRMKQEEIANIIYQYSNERASRMVARAIVNYREKKRIETTLELANIVRSAVPFSRKSKIDPATRTFQAIRMWVNDELQELEDALKASVKLLRCGGVVVVVTFHSEEDKIVKYLFRDLCNNEDINNKYKLVNRKIIRPSDEEINLNARSRSAKLRAIMKL